VIINGVQWCPAVSTTVLVCIHSTGNLSENNRGFLGGSRGLEEEAEGLG
jgi:hypothetical protein